MREMILGVAVLLIVSCIFALLHRYDWRK